MEDVKWGVPSQARAKKVEKYNTPVVTMVALEKKGASRKFVFNKAAREALKLTGGDSHIGFGFLPEDKTILIANFKKETGTTFTVTKSFSVRDKRTYEYIGKLLGFDTAIDNELHFNITENGHLKSYIPEHAPEDKTKEPELVEEASDLESQW